MGAKAPYSKVENMRKQGFSEEEIADMLKCDKAIDQGENLFPLDPSLEVGAKKARRADRTDTPKKTTRAEDADRRKIILLLASALGCVRTEDIVNPEREFSFMWNGKRYKVVLSVPRGQ